MHDNDEGTTAPAPVTRTRTRTEPESGGPPTDGGTLAKEGTVKQETELAADDPRRKENRPAAGVLPTGNLREPNIGGTTTAPTPVPPGPSSGVIR